MISLISHDPINFSMMLISIIGVVVALVFSVKANRKARTANNTAEMVAKHQIINDLFREYRQPDMASSVRAMWKLNPKGEDDAGTVAVRYESTLQKEHTDHPSHSIDFDRRRVSQFYIQLAVESENDPVFAKILYSIWSKQDLSIIHLVLIPIDEMVIQKKDSVPNVNDMNLQNRRLYNLWHDAQPESRTS